MIRADLAVGPHLPRMAYSIDQACSVTGLGRTSLYQLIKSGKLIARKCGRRTLIMADDLSASLNRFPSARD
jgi:excisionase family DNA binding protein